MSRIAKNPIDVPHGMKVNMAEGHIIVDNGKLTTKTKVHELVKVEINDDKILVRPIDDSKNANQHAGTTRANLNNVIIGLAKGFEKKLDIIGVGYRAQVQADILNLTLGYSHPVSFQIPNGITITTPTQTEVVIKGADKQQVGQVAAKIRAYRAPEPYKGKGVKYSDEIIMRKETKKGK